MAISTLQNTPIEINILDYVNNNGWSIENGELVHESCNAGTYTSTEQFEEYKDYEFSIKVESLSEGSIIVSLSDESSYEITNVGLHTFTLTSFEGSLLKIYSEANTRIRVISYRITTEEDDTESEDNIVYSLDAQKWIRFDNYYPDFAMSMFTNLYSFNKGNMYSHTDKDNKNSFYGINYESRIKFPMTQPKVVNYQSIKIECNELLITTEDGIKTSLGQVSNLIEDDFEMFKLDDGSSQISVYDYEGNYRANFLRAKPDVNFGDRLKGRWITVELSTKDKRDFNLYKVVVQSIISTPNE